MAKKVFLTNGFTIKRDDPHIVDISINGIIYKINGVSYKLPIYSPGYEKDCICIHSSFIVATGIKPKTKIPKLLNIVPFNKFGYYDSYGHYLQHTYTARWIRMVMARYRESLCWFLYAVSTKVLNEFKMPIVDYDVRKRDDFIIHNNPYWRSQIVKIRSKKNATFTYDENTRDPFYNFYKVPNVRCAMPDLNTYDSNLFRHTQELDHYTWTGIVNTHASKYY